MHAFTACKRLRVIEKYVFTMYAGIHERLDVFAVVDQATYIMQSVEPDDHFPLTCTPQCLGI